MVSTITTWVFSTFTWVSFVINWIYLNQFADYLTGEFLEEQYKGQRDLAGKISTLGKMVDSNGAELGEFLFDKSL